MIFKFIPKAMQDTICAKWMLCWTDLHNPLHGVWYCLDPEFHSHEHSACAEPLKDLFLMCDKVHGTLTRRAASAKAQLDWNFAWNRKCCVS